MATELLYIDLMVHNWRLRSFTALFSRVAVLVSRLVLHESRFSLVLASLQARSILLELRRDHTMQLVTSVVWIKLGLALMYHVPIHLIPVTTTILLVVLVLVWWLHVQESLNLVTMVVF